MLLPSTIDAMNMNEIAGRKPKVVFFPNPWWRNKMKDLFGPKA